MKQKQFFFALVAMLSFVFSGFAQTTVTTEAQLKAALESAQGGSVVLGNNIELSAQVTIPKKSVHTLDLNGKKITGGLYVYGTLTINDGVGTGELTASTYVLNGAGGSKIILNGGRVYRGSSWSVYTTGVFTVNGGVVENSIRVAGSGTIELNGGTVTNVQVTSGNLKITDSDATVAGNLNIEKGAKSVNISAGTINGDVTIATEAQDKVAVSGGSFKDADAIKDYLPSGSALLQKPDGTYEIVAGLLKIGDTYYPTLAAALAAAQDGATIELINQEGSVIAMNGSLYGKNVTITGTAKVDWNKGFLFVGRGGEGNATLTFDNANLTSVSNSSSYGIHVSGREKDTNNKYDGTLVIKNSTIVLDYLINKGAMTLDNSTLTVKNGFDLNGRPAKETENGEDANATLALTNNSKLVVNNHNGMGIGREGKGELTVDASSTFEHTQDFIVSANGTMDVKGTLVSNGKKLTNNGEVKFTATKLTAATIEGTGTTRFYNDVNFYGANSITTGINGTPFHLVINEGANLFITRFVLGYDRNITVNGTIADASAFNPAGQTPSLKFNSTSGVSVGGTGTGNLTVKNAYIELGSSSWKSAQGTYDWDFVNSYVSAVSFTNAIGADAATWDVTFDKSVLDAKNYIKNGKNVTYNFKNNSRGTTGSLRIDGVLNIDATSSVVTTSQQNNKVGAVDEHGGINGTVNVAGNLTIGSNAKTQLEVLGGTVNVVYGATLALGNNTMTLDAASALQSAGNISGAITAANGANVAITGGTYTQDVSNWCADGFMTQQNADGSFGIAKAAAKVGDKKYASLETAFKAATSGCTIEILSDVTVDYAWDARNTGGKFTVPVTINGNGKTIKFTASVNDNNYQAPFRFEADATVKNLTIDMSEVTDNRFRAISSKGNLTVDNSKFIGKDESLNCRAIIFGEGAGANVGNLAISITNSEFINWKRGITDNENAQDVKTVTITGNKMTDAGVGVSAKETVTFTGNTVAGAYVNIKSYTAGNKLAVTATGNTLEANTDAAYNVIDAGGVVNAEGFKVVAKGNNFNGYTNTDGIWGETWGNAKESFVIKVLDANGNVMGTTSLNNIGGIIDGDVNVSWNLKFNAAANTDEYWTMAWTTDPSISNMPARVALWVDGVEVSGGPVVLNGPDDLNKIVAAVTDADGKIISCHTSVANAAATNATNIALLRNTTEEIILPAGVKLNANGFTAANVKTAVAVIGTQKFASLQDAIEFAKAGDVVTIMPGTYPVPAMKAGITVEGEGEVLLEGTLSGTLENLTLKNLHIKGGNAQRWAYAKGDLVFENVTFEATSIYALHFDGIAAGTNLTYKNCTIIGWAAMGGTPASCVFEGCTIKGNGSYGVIRTYFDATIKDCTFDVANVNTTDAYEDGIHAVNGAKVVVTNCTNKNGEMKDLVNVHATSEVTVDGTVYKNVAKVGDNYYATLVEAFATVGDGAGKTIELIADVDLAGAEWTPVTFNGVFDGQNHTISNLVVNGAGKSNQGFFAQTNNGEIKNVTFDNAKVTGRLNVGVVAGTPYTSKYTNVKVTGHVEVNGMAYVGGVGGKNAYANWTYITVNVDETSYVKATSTENDKKYRTYVGGVIGFNGEGGHTFKNISSNIKVIGDVMDIGGIFGILHYGNNAENITFTGAVEAPAEAKEVGGIAGVWHNQQGQTVTITEAKSEGTVKVGDVTTTGSIVGGAYNAANQSPATSGSLMIDGKEVWVGLAKVGEVPYETLAAAVAAAKAGDTVTILDNITMSEILVIKKSIALDGNGKTLTYTGTDRAIDVPNDANANLDVTIKNLNVVATTANRGLNYNENGMFNVEGVTVTIGENVDGYAINFPGMADNAQVTIKDSKLTSRNPLNIWGENMTINVHNSEIISVDNSSTYDYAAIQLNNDNYGNVANRTTVNVYGGTITALNEKGEPSNVVANATETGVVNISDETVITGKVLNYVANIGGTYFGSLQAAVNAIEKYGYNSPIVIMKNFAAEATTIKSGLKVTINLNGKTITGTDNETKSYGLININPGAELTINGNGAITLTATQDREWNAYSSVISNQRGKLTVNGGTIEHLGGTAMAYAIDNLTNGKGTYAETIINGGTIKSPYRAIRQFLNGTEAQNILTVNGGTIEGTNKSIWMQDPSKNANTGNLTVGANAKLNGDVYLFVTAGSTEWPVNISIAAAALQDESKVVTGNVPAGYDLANVDGIYGIYSGAAKIGTTYFATIDEAIKAAKAGETVNILAGTYKVPSMKAGITVEGAVNADGTPAVLLEGTLSNTLENLTLKNLHIKGGNAQRWAYAKGNLVFENVIFEATSVYALHFDGIAAGTNLTYKNCTIIGWAAMGGTPESCVFEGCTIKGNGNYGVIRTYFEATIKDCTFDVANVNTNDAYQDGIHAVDADVVVDNCTNVNGDMKDLVNINGASKVTVDGVVYKNVAKVGDKNYITIEDAFAAWADGTTLTLLTDIALDTKTLATQNDGYAVLVNVNGKKVTLDLNGKKITVNAAAADLASAKGGMLLGVFSADLNGHLTLTDNTDAKNGAVTLNVNDAKVYGMFVSESKESDKSNSGKITVEAGNYATNGKVSNAMFFADANEVITVNGGNFHCDQVSNTANYPWMFNTVGNNELHVTVNGGTFNVDINHQHRPFEVKVPETLAVKANDNGTWTVVPAEAYITEMLGAFVNEAGEWAHKVGYATIAEAIAAVKDGQTITLVKDITYTKDNANVNGAYVDGLVYTGDKNFTIDFNSKTITENGDINDYLVYLKNAGEKDNEITFKNGTIAINSNTAAWAALTVGANSATHKTTLNLNGMKVVNGNPNDAANQVIRIRKGSVVNLNEGTVVTSNGTSYGVVAETTATVNINNGAKVVHTNSKTSGGNQVYTAVSGNGTINVYDGAEIVSDNYGIHNLTTGNAVINIYGGTIEAKVAVKASTNGGAGESATVTIEGGNFKGALENYTDAATIVVKGGTFDAAVDTKYVATGYICKDNGNGTFGVIVDPKHGKVAQIIRSDYYAENQYFATINEAVQAAVNGETVTLIADVETSAAGYATIGEEDYAVIVAVKEKQVTLDLNGKSVTVTPTAEELANAEGKMLMSVFGMDTNGKLTLKGNGSVKVNANGANVYSLVAAYGEGSAVVIENGNYEADSVIASGSLIYSHEMVTVMGGTYKLGNLATGANGSPWIFNTVGQNYTGVKVVGGTFPTDINHQFWANEVLVPETHALKDNGNGTWTVVDAVAYTVEKAKSQGAYFRHVGYASLEDAIAATGKYNCQDNTVTMIKDITLEPITIANGVKVALDLNGKTISGTDNGTASYGLITNKGDLTINGTGAITLTATQNRGWSAYSSVISNQVGGKLTVNGGTIQHLGGTSMAWGIDNLTNGKDTYAETVINGGVVMSKYIAIRQFLNGVEADNILTVNGGTLEGETASLYFQDPSKNANTGTLNVLGGTLAGDVYLDVTEGSTEWPVEVYIAKDALGQNDIHADNVPAEAAALVEYDTFWQVEQKNLAELTIEDACEEYINKIEKNVGVLTYKRYFDDTEWQTIVLPFDVPVDNLTAQFEVAYIYNASYKGKQATIDYVVIDENSAIETLRANYPYMIRAKAEGWNNIVVENAKLMPTTEVETLDCSSVFEKFSFIGSYATVDTETLDATKGYFNLISGAWSKLGTVNPFRFYMQIEKRNGNVNAFEYPEDTNDAKAIRMRQVDANGEATGIDSVGAVTEQNSGLIFDLHGRRVVEPKKGGLYIVNGKKVVF